MRGATTASHETKARLGDQIADLFAKLKPTGLTSRASRRGPLLRAREARDRILSKRPLPSRHKHRPLPAVMFNSQA